MLYRLLILAALTGCATAVKVPSIKSPGRSKAEASWAKVLAACVDGQGRIDFNKAQSMRRDLHAYVAYIAETNAMSLPAGDQRLAYYLNSYNALAMYGVLEAGIPKDFDGFFKRLRFFILRTYVIGGERQSLYSYENNVIRALGEPRVHVALNCMSVGCPRLPQQAFTGDRLQTQLDAAAKEFFNSKTYVQVYPDKKLVKLSEILDFFTEDFVNPKQAPNLIAYVNRYRQNKIPENYEVDFIPYDWTVNKQ